MAEIPQITQNFGRPSYRPDAPAGALDPDMRRMAIAAAGFGGVLALVIMAFSLSHHVHHGVPVIQALAGPVRVKPLHPGGMQVAGAEEQSAGQPEKLSPPAEKPELRALRAKQKVKAAPRSGDVAAASLPAVETAPVRTAAIAPAVPMQRASAMQPVSAASEAKISGMAVQLAAFDSEQAAQQDWGKMAEKMPALFDGHRPQVQRAQLAGRNVFRLRTGGFASIAEATEFCGKVRARGGDCSIAAF